MDAAGKDEQREVEARDESLVAEVEQSLGARVEAVVGMSSGAHNQGFHIRLADRRDVVARVSRADVGGSRRRLWDARFELAVYETLRPLGGPLGRPPLYHREPDAAPDGRRLFVFERAEGESFDYHRWRALSARDKSCLLARSAELAATLFRLDLPEAFASSWLLARVLGPEARGPDARGRLDVRPTRDFCAALLAARIERASGRGALTPEVRDALLRLVPRVLPPGDDPALYRFVLDHGDFGMHNMTIARDARGPRVTSVYDWEAATIVPALFSEPKMVVTADLVVEHGEPSVRRWGDGDSRDRMDEYRAWSAEYFRALFAAAPEYRDVIRAGRDARYVWFGVEDPPALAQLGAWALSATDVRMG